MEQIRRVRDALDAVVAESLWTGGGGDDVYQEQLHQTLAKLLLDMVKLCEEQRGRQGCMSVGGCVWTAGRLYGGTCAAAAVGSMHGLTTMGRVQKVLLDIGPEIQRLRHLRRKEGLSGAEEERRLRYLEGLEKQALAVEEASSGLSAELVMQDRLIREAQEDVKACESNPSGCGGTVERWERENRLKVYMQERRDMVETWGGKMKRYAPEIAKVVALVALLGVGKWTLVAGSVFLDALRSTMQTAVQVSLGGFGGMLGWSIGALVGDGKTTTKAVGLGLGGMVGVGLAAWLMASDSRLKKNIVPLTVRPGPNLYRFKYRQKARRLYGYDSGYQIGVVAQEVELYYPECVVRSREGYLMVDYACLVRRIVAGPSFKE